MKEEIIESRFFITNSKVATPEVFEAYEEAKRWQDNQLDFPESCYVVNFFPGEHDGSKGFFVQKFVREFGS